MMRNKQKKSRGTETVRVRDGERHSCLNNGNVKFQKGFYFNGGIRGVVGILKIHKKGKAAKRNLHQQPSQIIHSNIISLPIQQINHKGMSRYRKKACLEERSKPSIVILDSETDEHEQVTPLLKRVKGGEKAKTQPSANPYEKIRQIPQIVLTKSQMMADPFEIILKLQQKYKEFGAVKIKACPEWNPPFNFRYTEKGITTRIQKIHRLKQGKAFDQKIEAYNIKSFTEYAENFQKGYKFRFEKEGTTKEAEMENQYWKIVNGVGTEDPKLQQRYKVTIQYAADLPTHQYGSGFPQYESSKFIDEHFNYATSLFNLNNVYKSPNSILRMSEKNNEKISGVTIPWVYMGMQFSTFCWHVEDLWLNSINYSHRGATKTWYIIPECDKQKFDAYVLKKTGKREFLNSITYMIDPLQLINQGIKVYKAYQRPHEYILTLFNAYHGGFSQGFNVGEAVNVVDIDSLNVIKRAQLYNSITQKNHKPPVLCFDWLVAANVGNTHISQDIIVSEYSKLVSMELQRIKKLVQKGEIVKLQFVDKNLKYDRLSCHSCRYYQYMSILKCSECEKKYCLQHADRCCGKGFIFVTRESDRFRKKTIDCVTGGLH